MLIRPTSFFVPLVSFSFPVVVLPTFATLRQPVLERIDDFVNQLAIRRLVPPDPVTHVAPKTAAPEQRRMVGGGGLAALFAGEVRRGGGGGAGDEVGEDLPVLRRESRGEGEDGGWEEGEVV